MPLADIFIFSANNLQDYLDCPRRFELKYLLKQNWPAVTSQPVLEMENKILQGNRFHLIAHQYLSGIAGEILRNSVEDPELGIWFDHFRDYIDQYLNFEFFSEFSVIMSFDGFRLMAVFDFISMNNTNKIRICDWKTTSRVPKREIYLQHIQSIMYPFLAFETHTKIFPQTLQLKHQGLSMEYWFPGFPENIITWEYSSAIHANSRELLSNLIAEISQKKLGNFEKTSNDKLCAFCQYRSLCERGIQAGLSKDDENELESKWASDDLDFDQVEEIAF
jgi:hypothetical protein